MADILPMQIDGVWFTRILYALRDVELDLTRLSRHDGSAGLEQVQESVAVLRKVIESAIENAK